MTKAIKCEFLAAFEFQKIRLHQNITVIQSTVSTKVAEICFKLSNTGCGFNQSQNISNSA